MRRSFYLLDVENIMDVSFYEFLNMNMNVIEDLQ